MEYFCFYFEAEPSLQNPNQNALIKLVATDTAVVTETWPWAYCYVGGKQLHSQRWAT